MTTDAGVLVDRLLEVIETEIVPLTEAGVRRGNKVFGAAILRKSDRSLVIAGTNNETENPLWHGEVHTIKGFYELPRDARPDPRELLFVATHEPCSLCLSAITWCGFDNFYYLFSHEDSRDSFSIPHDLRILKEVFRLEPGGYARSNHYWQGHSIAGLIDACAEPVGAGFRARVARLEDAYVRMSDAYQRTKGDAEIPLD